MSDVVFASSLPVEHHREIEALLFFNRRQAAVRPGIVAAIDRYGTPEIVNDGRCVRVRVSGPVEVQCLFAVERHGEMSRPVGIVLYTRDSFERITIVHLVVAAAYAAGGPLASRRLPLRLVQAVRRVARRTSGIRRVELIYSAGRARRAGVGRPAVERAAFA